MRPGEPSARDGTAEEAPVCATERRYRSVFDSSPIGIALVGMDLRLQEVNAALCDMLGYTESELTARSVPDITHPDDVGADRDLMQQVFADTLPSYRVERRFLRRSGEVIHISFAASGVRDQNGEPLRGVAMVQDITNQARMQQELLQAQKLESIGLLAGGIAHNFNNALTAIYGYSELLLRRLGPDDPAAADIRRILTVAERSASLTKQLLVFSRQQQIQPERFELNDTVRTALELLEPLIGIDMTLELSLYDGPSTVQADSAEIDQVILNLVLNARDAMPDGGRLGLETGEVELDVETARRYPDVRPGRYVRLTVTDSGSGMEPDTLAKVFEPFFTTKEVGRGVGLGLAMAHGVVKRGGGHIAVESVVGQGSTFTLLLPLAPLPDAEPDGGDTPSSVARNTIG